MLRGRRRAGDRLLGVAARQSGLQHNRYGYAVGRRVGGAVARNRVRRRLREIVRHARLEAGYDVVVTAREASVLASFEELSHSFATNARAIGLLMDESA